MKNLGRFTQFITVGDIDILQQCRIEAFVDSAFVTVLRCHLVTRKIHRNKAFVALDDAVLQSTRDAEFTSLDA